MSENSSPIQGSVRFVGTPAGRLKVTDYAGDGPAIVMTHGFPDDSRIYDRLVPELACHRAVTFDFLGYGGSDRPADIAPLMPGEHEAELGAVIDALELERVILVGHDAGGPVVTNWALDHPDRVHSLVLLNTYYGTAPTLQFPEMIRLFADPDLAPLADAIVADPQLRGWLLAHTGGRFGVEREGRDAVAEVSVTPQFFGDETQPDARAAIRAWTAELFVDLAIQDHRITHGRLGGFLPEVRLPFGVRDPYLNLGVARHIAAHFPHALVQPIDGASHWPQWDMPEATASAIVADV